MKLVRGSKVVAMYPESGDGFEVHRYQELGITGINLVRAHQPPHTIREGLVASEHVMYVVSGTLTARVNGREVEIGPGDAIHYLPRENRWVANNTDETAVLLLIDKGPGVPISSGPDAAPSGGPQ